MQTETPTFTLALKVWWAWLWRAAILAIGISFAVGFVLGIIKTVLGLPEMFLLVNLLAGFAIGFYFSVRVLRNMMVKGFGKKYRLAVVKIADFNE